MADLSNSVSTNTSNISNLNDFCNRLVAWHGTTISDDLYSNFKSHGNLNWYRLGKLLVIGGSIYSTSALSKSNHHIILARAAFPYGVTSLWGGVFNGYNDGCSGSVGIFDSYNLSVWPRQGDVPANVYINILAIGYSSDSV